MILFTQPVEWFFENFILEFCWPQCHRLVMEVDLECRHVYNSENAIKSVHPNL